MKAMIVEDEAINLRVLEKMLERYPDIEIVGKAESRKEALAILREHTPDVIFLDILLPDGSGFDILSHVDDNISVIFTTGHGSYAVQAFEINAVDYLLKPFSHDRLAEAIRRMESLKRKNVSRSKGDEGTVFKLNVDQLLVKTGSEQRFVQYSDVLAVVSEGGNYTSVHYNWRKPAIIRKTLKELEATLPTGQFFRIHRSCIINASKIVRLSQKDGCVVYLDGMDDPYKVSRRHVADIKKAMTPPS